jgi:hypothetical protein
MKIMNNMNIPLLPRALVVLSLSILGLACGAHAQSTIDPAHKFSWSENCGWMNWADAGDGSQSVLLNPTYLSGFVWCENIGYINLGDGSPANGTTYANLNGLDFGVNILPNENLSGLGWGENVGWINFNTAPTLTAFNQQARFTSANQRFSGYAWGENIGWINLDDSVHFVGTVPSGCIGDYNQDGGVDGSDVEAFFADWSAGFAESDVNQDGGVDGTDVEFFFEQWSAGC